jgi:histidine triad (HIT) family protein
MHIMGIAQRIGRKMRDAFEPQRVGMVVHGYGVPHAHLILVPQNGPHDITSARYAHLEHGEIAFSLKNVPLTSRATLDEHARLLKI